MNTRLYLILGSDGLEYGPVSDVEVCQWIVEGRAGRDTRIQIEGSSEWTRISALSEFSGPLSLQTERIEQRIAHLSSGESDRFKAFVKIGRDLDLNTCFSRSWTLLTKNPVRLIGMSLFFGLVLGALLMIPTVGPFVVVLVGLGFLSGYEQVFLKLIRGQRTHFMDLFSGFYTAWFHLTLAGVTASLLIGVGLALCVLPGIYLAMAWLPFTPLLIVDHRLGFWTGLETSRRLVTALWPTFTTFALTLMAALVGGILLAGVGIFIALPLAIGAVVFAYEDIFNSPKT
ncbi:MAG: hypothetical protein K9N62_01505 [Verrucomicrobia bacterium]|jgi:hypothetical protein|nr:hypothetical protein [Verrucomicrobiota bacterium]